MTDQPRVDRTGKCLCGAITFEARGVKLDASACHCGMCRRWASGPLLSAPCAEVSWKGEAPATIESSNWAERGFCAKCGTSLFYRLTQGKYQGTTSIALGALEDQSGFRLNKEWFIDKKPESYTFADETQEMTEAQIFEMYAPKDSGE